MRAKSCKAPSYARVSRSRGQSELAEMLEARWATPMLRHSTLDKAPRKAAILMA